MSATDNLQTPAKRARSARPHSAKPELTAIPVSRAASRETMKHLTESFYVPRSQVKNETMRSINDVSAYLEQQLRHAIPRAYHAPHITQHLQNRGKQTFMPRIGNAAHSAQSNNGYNRKLNGTFYCH